MVEARRGVGLQAILAWSVTGLLVTAPIWLTVGVRGLALGLLGPSGVLLFKPGEQFGSKLLVALLLSLPTIVGLFVVIWKWSKLAARGRALSIVLLSVLWHGIGAALWLLILNGLN